MNFVVTGGNGFIGSNIVKILVENNHKVLVLSNSDSSLKNLLSKIQFENINLDFDKLEKKIKNFSPDVVLHSAWSGGNSYKYINDLSQFNDNLSLGVKILKCIKSFDKKVKFVGIGSFTEYGLMTEPASEDFQENPINYYGLAKYTFKRFSKIFCDENFIDWVWVRPCYVYGPGDVKTRLIPILIKKFKNNENLELDECLTILDYIYIDDFTKILYLLIKSENTGIYNICSGKKYELRYIIETIHNILKSKSIITYNKALDKKYLSKFVCGNNEKILKATNYEIQYDIESGLVKTINNI